MHACSKIKMTTRWCPISRERRFLVGSRGKTRFRSYADCRIQLEKESGWEKIRGFSNRLPFETLLVGQKCWYFGQSKNTNAFWPAAAGQPRFGRQIKQQGRRLFNLSTLLVGWAVYAPEREGNGLSCCVSPKENPAHIPRRGRSW